MNKTKHQVLRNGVTLLTPDLVEELDDIEAMRANDAMIMKALAADTRDDSFVHGVARTRRSRFA